MPAYAHGDDSRPTPATQAATATAPVIDLAERRQQRANPPVAPLEDPRLVEMLKEQGLQEPRAEACALARALEQYVGRHGASLEHPEAAAAVRGVADFLERLAYGALAVREGDPAQGIVPNPDDGMDRIGAGVLVGIAEDLREAPRNLGKGLPTE
jgi:hypothetical protein